MAGTLGAPPVLCTRPSTPSDTVHTASASVAQVAVKCLPGHRLGNVVTVTQAAVGTGCAGVAVVLTSDPHDSTALVAGAPSVVVIAS